MRKHVKPALPTAVIPDPERARDLPAEGYEVTWSVHWERMAARGDIIVSDPAEAGEAPIQAPEPQVEAPVEAETNDHHQDA